MMIKGPEGIAGQLKGAIAADGPALDTEAFKARLEEAIAKVDAEHDVADAHVQGLAAGEDVGLHETMMALERADISTRLFVSVTRKAVEAYQEMMRMQI